VNQAAFALNLAVQAMAFAWFAWPQYDGLEIRRCSRIPPVLHAYQARSVVNSYRQAHLSWLAEVEAAQLQAASWRSVALASIAVCAVLTTLAIPDQPTFHGLGIASARVSVEPPLEVSSQGLARAPRVLDFPNCLVKYQLRITEPAMNDVLKSHLRSMSCLCFVLT
jgi:hypothetical protein